MPVLTSELGVSLLTHCQSSESDISIMDDSMPEVTFLVGTRCCRASRVVFPASRVITLWLALALLVLLVQQLSAAHSADARPRNSDRFESSMRLETSSSVPVLLGAGASSLERPSSTRACSSRPAASPFRHSATIEVVRSLQL